MGIIEKTKRFFLNGMRVFRMASSGGYDVDSKEVRDMRKEVYGFDGSQESDSMRLKSDMMNIGNDMRNGINKVVFGNG